MATPNTYKNGGVAVFKALEIVCRIVKRFGPKLITFIDDLLTSGHLTTAQHDTAVAFLNAANATCAIFSIIAAQQGS